MGYVIDQTARTFSTKRSSRRRLLPALNNPTSPTPRTASTAALEPSGLQLLLGYTDYDSATEERLLRAMLGRRPEGVVVTGGAPYAGDAQLLKAAGIPVVETWDLPAQPVEHCVGFSNAEAVAQLVRQLHDWGYRRIAFLGGVPQSDARGADRRRGFEMAARELAWTRRASSAWARRRCRWTTARKVSCSCCRWPDTDALRACPTTRPSARWPNASAAASRCPGQLAIAGFGGFEVGASCHLGSRRWRWTAPASAAPLANCCCARHRRRARGPAAGAETVMIPYRVDARQHLAAPSRGSMPPPQPRSPAAPSSPPAVARQFEGFLRACASR